LAVDFVLSATDLPAVSAPVLTLVPAPAGFGVLAAGLAGAADLAGALAGALVVARLAALVCLFAVVEPLALSATALEAL
jgi:hypothetical protein